MAILVNEIYGPVIQGEGSVIGVPTIFLRTGGCDFRCDWCDSLYAVLPKFKHNWTPMEPDEIWTEIVRLSNGVPCMITLTGGNPALHNFTELIEIGNLHGYTFAIETQGSIIKHWFAKLDVLCISPKPPSSLMKTDWMKLDKCVEFHTFVSDTFLKVVVFDDIDYEYAMTVRDRYPNIPLYLQVGNPTVDTDKAVDVEYLLDQFEELSERVLRDRLYNVRVLPQLHVLVFGNKRKV